MALESKHAKLLAECSVRDGEQRYTENQIKALTGAPECDDQFDEDGICVFCGEHEEAVYHYKCWR